MDKKLDNLVQHIQDGVSHTLKNDIFNVDVNYTPLISACKEFLIYKGYKVVDPIEHTYSVKKLDDLIHLFYVLSDTNHPDLMNNYRDLDKDRILAKRFIESRVEISNINKEEALKECAQIIDVIFKYEEEFNFDVPITFGVLGQKNCGWITDKAIQIINRERINKRNERRDKIIAEFEEIYNKEQDNGFGDLNEILKNL